MTVKSNLAMEGWQAKSTKIFLRQLRFHAFHGVLDQERRVGNDYVINVVAECDFAHAMQTDELEDTVNYAEIYRVVKEEMAFPSKLLEHVAGRIGERLFNEFPSLQSLDISIMKVNPPFGADCEGAGVEVHLMNYKTLCQS
nr:dihydroneopterin aldolase [uncultured Prevotella sp.]